ncbi:MAG: acyl-ACP--UDP-N-acetylglucosamine O-acyltransferase [Methylocystis sp.]|nr:acyl-ACP--UDP-N-acetylglucosamine O-acyltransferase [Methylocystis sp.]
MSFRIHSSAIVESGAVLGEGAVVGPYCHVGAHVELGADVELASHVVVSGETRIGAGTRIFPFASLGNEAQDLQSLGEPGTLSIGAHCIIREGVTINLGSSRGGAGTKVGDHCAFLAYSHIAHDCQIGDHIVLSNNVLLGGHVEAGDHVMIGGASAVHQHVRIGAHAFVAGLSGLEGDVIPFGLAGGNRAHLFGLNLVGLRRRGFSSERIAALRAAYRLIFAREGSSREHVMAERIESAATQFSGQSDVAALLDFLRASSVRPLCAPRPPSRR